MHFSTSVGCATDEMQLPWRCLQVGLGTDVAGGYSPSMLNAMRSAVLAAKAVRMLRTDRARLAKRDRAPDGILHEDAEQTRSRQGEIFSLLSMLLVLKACALNPVENMQAG